MNGGFGLVLDGTAEAAFKADSMLNWDVSNGVARRYVNGLFSIFFKFYDLKMVIFFLTGAGVETKMPRKQLIERWLETICFK